MVKTTLDINDDVWEGFRKTVRIKFGSTYGNINRAITEALEKWQEPEKGE